MLCGYRIKLLNSQVVKVMKPALLFNPVDFVDHHHQGRGNEIIGHKGHDDGQGRQQSEVEQVVHGGKGENEKGVIKSINLEKANVSLQNLRLKEAYGSKQLANAQKINYPMINICKPDITGARR